MRIWTMISFKKKMTITLTMKKVRQRKVNKDYQLKNPESTVRYLRMFIMASD